MNTEKNNGKNGSRHSMGYICEFCGLKFKTLTEKTIKDSTQIYRYFESLNRKYGKMK